MDTPGWYEGNVSRETLDKLSEYEQLLRKWTSKINLISKGTVDDIEARHIWDSAQIYGGDDQDWLDIGSGGGLPAVVVAILAQGDHRSVNMTMVESDQRKAMFLRTCARHLEVPFAVSAQRIESIEPHSAATVSARALSRLDTLLGLAARHLASDGACIFMKGEAWQDEIAEAKRNWRFSCDATPSKTNPRAAILRIKDIERV